jgi:hypothetical protein
MLPDEALAPAPAPKSKPAPAAALSDDLDMDFDLDFDVPAPQPAAKAAFKPTDALDALDELLGPDTGGDVDSRRPSQASPTDTIETELGEFFDEAFASKPEVPKQVAAKSEVTPAAAVPSLASLANFDALPPMRPFSDYEKPGVQAQTFDLAKDDGLDLVRDVNAVLTDALDTESSGLVLDGRVKTDNLYFYDDSHAAAERQPLKGDPAKFINRVKAMAKIESYREGATGKGHCNLVLDGLPRKAYVEVEKTPTGDILVMHFWGK